MHDDDPRLINHPMKRKPNWRQRAVPLVIHGDGAVYTSKENSIKIVSIRFMQGLGWGWDSIFLLAAFVTSCANKSPNTGPYEDTWETIWKHIVCGLNALFHGFHPTVDGFGNPWPQGSYQDEIAGKPIADGHWFGVVWGGSCDLEYICNGLYLANYSSYEPCWLCPANRSPGCGLNIRDVGPNNTWKDRSSCLI